VGRAVLQARWRAEPRGPSSGGDRVHGLRGGPLAWLAGRRQAGMEELRAPWLASASVWGGALSPGSSGWGPFLML
jgi:hypothetical protein